MQVSVVGLLLLRQSSKALILTPRMCLLLAGVLPIHATYYLLLLKGSAHAVTDKLGNCFINLVHNVLEALFNGDICLSEYISLYTPPSTLVHVLYPLARTIFAIRVCESINSRGGSIL